MKRHVKNRILIIIIQVFFVFSFGSSCVSIKKVTEDSEGVSEIRSSTELIEQDSEDNYSIEKIITTLSSDEFEGRRTFSAGNERAGEYIANIFENIGLDPLFENSYFQKYKQNASNTKDASYMAVSNIVGYIKGKNSEEAVVISAHFDSLGIKEGNIYRGALDNASGLAALIELAKKLKQVSKEYPFELNIIFCAFNGEEQLYMGSSAFVKQAKSKSWYKNMYNINIDCIGAKDGGKLIFPYDSKYSAKLYEAVKNSMNKNNIELVETKQIFGSDHRSFEKAQKANISINQENLRKWANKPIDTPDILDFEQIQKIANALSDFIKNNDGMVY